MKLFKNRMEAALQLVDPLKSSLQKRPLILAIPRGGVPMGSVLASQLEGDLDVVLVHKMGAPGQQELAIGAVDELGEAYLHPYAKELKIPKFYLEEEKLEQLHVLKKRRNQFTPHRKPLDPKGRTIIVVDDGIATGSTMIAALCSIRSKNPERLIVAVPVASAQSLRTIEKYADQVVCLQTPDPFYAVGEFYDDFSQVSDQEVIDLLNKEEAKSA